MMVVNDAVLRLTGYRPPDLVKLVYSDQSISTRWNDNRSNVDLSTPARPLEKGYGYGGGLMPGAGDTRLRTLFSAIAYDSGLVRTDANGSAERSFTLPDDLTTWRVLAVAFTRDARFGNGEATFVSTKPLVTNPILPQFARPGDVLDGGVSVTATHGTGNSWLSMGCSAAVWRSWRKTGRSERTTQQANLTGPSQAFRYAMKVVSPQDGTVRFSSILGDAHDAFQVPLSIRTNDVLSRASFSRSGTTDSAAQVPLAIAAGTADRRRRSERDLGQHAGARHCGARPARAAKRRRRPRDDGLQQRLGGSRTRRCFAGSTNSRRKPRWRRN